MLRYLNYLSIPINLNFVILEFLLIIGQDIFNSLNDLNNIARMQWRI